MPPIKLAIIGAGPSSFYVASRLLASLPPSSPHHSALRIHMYDRLWAPHGLVRYGVAPDHPEVKNCTHKFDDAASDLRLQFFGNVNIITTPPIAPVPGSVMLPLKSLISHYTHLLLSSGCTLPTLHPALPPSDDCVSALSLVHWYTQHPSVVHKPPPPLEKYKHVSIIGQGNVSLDVARMLLTPPSTLEKYDVPESVLEVLRRSSIKHVSILGRRGPLQAAFTTKELREMMNLEDSSMVPIDHTHLAIPEGTKLTRQQSRTMQLLQKGSKNKPGLDFQDLVVGLLRSPTGLAPPLSSLASPSLPYTLSLAHNELSPEMRAIPTGETSTLRTSMVVTALGHQAEPTIPWYDPSLRHVRAVGSRVVNETGHTMKNVYASGWAAMGARGVLVSTMIDAYGVADTMLADSFPEQFYKEGDALRSATDGGSLGDLSEVMAKEADLDSVPEEVLDAKATGNVTDYNDWRMIDQEEVRRGEKLGKERERMNWEDAKAFLGRMGGSL
ncbi:hypothetical protein QCA50_001071 [Cerrena zonata]|uniref:NADPH:adrenodoxin oxidoreductase, mitochondrial n=1 Tax=Cerrena zonata TaxID=2478898 RepID=A0AAW0H0S5_9APHY